MQNDKAGESRIGGGPMSKQRLEGPGVWGGAAREGWGGAAREGSGLGVLPGRAQGHPGTPRALPTNTEHAPRASGEERQAGVPWFD